MRCVLVLERCGGYRITCLHYYQRATDIPDPSICHHCNKPIETAPIGTRGWNYLGMQLHPLAAVERKG